MLMVQKGFHFPFGYQEMVQTTIQNLRGKPIQGEPSFRVMKTHYIFVERKCFLHLYNNST